MRWSASAIPRSSRSSPPARGRESRYICVLSALKAAFNPYFRGMKSPDVAPYWGLRSRADPGGHVTLRASLFANRMPPRAFYFGRTAAAIHGLPLPLRFIGDTRLHVGVPAGARRVDALGTVPHHVRVAPQDVVFHRSMRVSSVGRTWCDLAASGLTLAELVAAGDRTVWWRAPRTTVDELEASILRYEGRRGARLMRTAFDLLSDRSDSAPESEVRVAVVLAGFPPRQSRSMEP